jgi:hypothetical protein
VHVGKTALAKQLLAQCLSGGRTDVCIPEIKAIEHVNTADTYLPYFIDKRNKEIGL